MFLPASFVKTGMIFLFTEVRYQDFIFLDFMSLLGSDDKVDQPLIYILNHKNKSCFVENPYMSFLDSVL